MTASLNDRPNKVEVSGDAATVTAGAGVQGAQGEPGIIISATQPTETDVLWADTSAAGSMVVPAGGTTGQVLAKASASDYDSEWVTPSSGGIPATIIDAAGDLIVGTAADTAARLAVGSNGQRLIANSNAAAGTTWVGTNHTKLGTGRGIPNELYVPVGTTTLAAVANRLNFLPILLNSAINISDVSADISSLSAGNLRIGLYNAAVVSNLIYPTTLIEDFGAVSTGSTGLRTISSLNRTIGPGLYALAYATDATPTFRIVMYLPTVNGSMVVTSGGSNLFLDIQSQYASFTYGSLPASFPTGPASVQTTATLSPRQWFPIFMQWSPA